MTKSLLNAGWEIWIDDPRGARLAFVDRVIVNNLTRSLNSVGAFSVSFPLGYYDQYLTLDGIVEIWMNAGVSRRIFTGFSRSFTYSEDSNGLEIVTVSGPETNDILRTAIVAYYAGSSQAEKTGYADNIIKAIVRENRGSLATGARNFSSLGLTVSPDLSLAPIQTKGFSRENMLAIIQEICETSRQAGTDLYFDLVAVDNNNLLGFDLRTYVNLYGNDHSSTGDEQIIFSSDDGNLANATLTIDYSDEINYIYAGGQGEGVEREIVEVSDTVRIKKSPWNLREAFVDARDQETTAGVTARANAELSIGRPFAQFTADLLDTPYARFAVDWYFGDKISVKKSRQIYDAMVKAYRIGLDQDARQTLECKIEVDL